MGSPRAVVDSPVRPKVRRACRRRKERARRAGGYCSSRGRTSHSPSKAGDATRARAAAETIAGLAAAADRHPFAQQVIRIQSAEARAIAAQAAGDTAGAIRGMQEATAIEDSISALSQPPYPIIPAHELYGTMLLEMGRPAEARGQFEETLRRTPGRAKAVYGIARAAEATGDFKTGGERYAEFLRLWKRADGDRPELAAARRFLDANAPRPAGGAGGGGD